MNSRILILISILTLTLNIATFNAQNIDREVTIEKEYTDKKMVKWYPLDHF